MLTLLCKTKNNFNVYIDLENSHAATHFQDTPQLKELVKEILTTYQPKEEYVRFQTDLGRTIGKSDLVKTNQTDEIIFAKRKNRQELMRFVKNKQSEDTSYVTIDLRKIKENTYELFTAYIGQITPHYPGQSDETEESKPFWNSHALVWGKQEIIPGTETSRCPW